MREILYAPADRCEPLFVLKRSRVRLYRETLEGRKFTLAVIEGAPSSGRGRSPLGARGTPTPSAWYGIPVRFTHHQLGTMIGTTNREAVTRAFAQLREAVQTACRTILVRDIEA